MYSPCQAQFSNDRTVPHFGIKGGINFTNLYTNDASNAEMITGFNVGVYAKVPITAFLAIQPELFFTTKGAAVTYNTFFVDGTAGFHLNYMELPLLLVVNITKHLNIHAGPYAALLVSGIAKNISTVNLFNFEQNINTSDYSRIDAGFAVGAGIDLGAFCLGARFDYGLTNVGKPRTFLGTTYTVPDAKNGVINFYASIALN